MKMYAMPPNAVCRVTTLSGKAGNLEMSGNFKMVREKSGKMLKICSSQGKVREFMWSGKNIKITFFSKHNTAN